MLAICIESSHARGMGHVYRAVNLARALAQRGMAPLFLVNDHLPALKIIADQGFACEVVPLFADCGWERALIARHDVRLWINDRLDTGASHAQLVRHSGARLVTFDDRGAGAAYADLNVAALVFDGADRLQGARVLHGAEYLVLNPEIEKFQRRRTSLQSILVTLGGADTYGVSVAVVSQLARLGKSATVVVGPAFAHWDALRQAMPASFVLKTNVPSFIAEYWHHDLAITGGGVTPFEACASGLPCAVLASETFEVPVGKALAAMGGAVFLGHHESPEWDLLVADLDLPAMSAAGMTRIGTHGVDRVVDAIAGYL